MRRKFADIPYARPDYAAYGDRIAGYAGELRRAESFEALCRTLDAFAADRARVDGSGTLAFIRCYQDSSDAFYGEEMTFNQTQSAMVDAAPVYDALLESPFRREIDGKFGKRFLLTIEKKRSLIRGGQALMGREQELIARYQNLITTIKYPCGEREFSAAEMAKIEDSPDRAVRRAARGAVRRTFAEKSGEFLDILEELVFVRRGIAQANGYASYLEYMDVEKGRYAYGEAELTRVCELVRRELVPLRERVYARLRERLGLETYTVDDTGLYFREGNPKPLGDAAFLLERAGELYRRMDPAFSALFEDMRSGGYIDCQESAHKITGMGFCTEILSEKLPFIFGNCTGGPWDTDVLVHEFGHSIQMKLGMDRFSLPECWTMPNDLVEVPSKAMEQLVYEYESLFFGEDAERYVELHLMQLLEEICGFCRTTEFETYLYTAETFDREEVVRVYNRLAQAYDAGVDFTPALPELEKGCGLVQNKGLFMYPRYLISYSLSDFAAAAIRTLYEEDRERGLAVYKRLCALGGSMGCEEAMEALGLTPPYTEEAVLRTRDYLVRKLGLAEARPC